MTGHAATGRRRPRPGRCGTRRSGHIFLAKGASNLSEVKVARNGLKYSVQLTTGSGTALGSPVTGALTATGTLDAGTATIAISSPVDASSVTGVSVVIYS